MSLQQHTATSGNPHISRIFLECDFDRVGPEGNVLVVETSLKPRYDDRDLDELLMNLGDIQSQARESMGSFERIDIRFV